MTEKGFALSQGHQNSRLCDRANTSVHPAIS